MTVYIDVELTPVKLMMSHETQEYGVSKKGHG